MDAGKAVDLSLLEVVAVRFDPFPPICPADGNAYLFSSNLNVSRFESGAGYHLCGGDVTGNRAWLKPKILRVRSSPAAPPVKSRHSQSVQARCCACMAACGRRDVGSACCRRSRRRSGIPCSGLLFLQRQIWPFSLRSTSCSRSCHPWVNSNTKIFC